MQLQCLKWYPTKLTKVGAVINLRGDRCLVVHTKHEVIIKMKINTYILFLMPLQKKKRKYIIHPCSAIKACSYPFEHAQLQNKQVNYLPVAKSFITGSWRKALVIFTLPSLVSIMDDVRASRSLKSFDNIFKAGRIDFKELPKIPFNKFSCTVDGWWYIDMFTFHYRSFSAPWHYH